MMEYFYQKFIIKMLNRWPCNLPISYWLEPLLSNPCSMTFFSNCVALLIVGSESIVNKSLLTIDSDPAVYMLVMVESQQGFFVSHPVNGVAIAVYEYLFQLQMNYRATDAG